MRFSLAHSLSLAITICGVAAGVPKSQNAVSKIRNSQSQTQNQREIYVGNSSGRYSSRVSIAYTGTSSGPSRSVTSTSSSVLASSSTETVVIVTSTSAEYSTSTSGVYSTSTASNDYSTSTSTSEDYYTRTSVTPSRPTGACATPITNPGFELTSPPARWRRQYPNPETPYNFRATTNDTDPHSGEQCASVMYTKGAIGYETWFNQHISLCEKTLYNFQSVCLSFPTPAIHITDILLTQIQFTKVSKEGTGCSVRYQVADRNGTVLAGLVGHSSQDLTTEWLEGNATYLSGAGTMATKASIDVRINCYGTATEDRAWYFDDISLVAA
ncbi:hypothetical protein HYALB_00001696 [Hymenoscyphus albidus]|uniref:Uncharacterized protein n=1 Tax=Hymenoscyphus albidus TaxID=595503 RepID=A0A9N9LFN2_9HELO|nr:hypothetical protein HYALB_00001696 [Hymenoscyphus albidus]